ncbi:MAG: hypothetical protein JXA21_18000 [Anaerolineae bacterium]|nr:hypothetical protein [Anaerolineae bacterium]
MSTETSLTERWLWLVVSFGIALLATGVRLAQDLVNKRDPFSVRAHPTNPQPAWLIQSLRMLYAVGIPALALLWRGALTESGLGLKPIHWAATDASNWTAWISDAGWACTLALGTGLILWLGNFTRAQTPPKIQHRADIALREAVFHQAHWAFYREPFVLLWGVKVGAWLGLILIAFEAIVNPIHWNELRLPSRGRNLLIRTGIAIMSVMIYIQTQNLWVAILADTALGWGLGQQAEQASA